MNEKRMYSTFGTAYVKEIPRQDHTIAKEKVCADEMHAHVVVSKGRHADVMYCNKCNCGWHRSPRYI